VWKSAAVVRRKPDKAQSICHTFLHRTVERSRDHQRLGNDVADPHARTQRTERVLEDSLNGLPVTEDVPTRKLEDISSLKNTLPAVGRSSRRISLVVVVFPQPDSPTCPRV
jgi:hypothetical protein